MLESITRHQWISEAAYIKAEARGFGLGGNWTIGWKLSMNFPGGW
ncbi:hypothetical protein [Candidatus Methylobacter favarea]|nr:hypothetical protein [Candidatus Methylobacter favarea]